MNNKASGTVLCVWFFTYFPLTQQITAAFISRLMFTSVGQRSSVTDKEAKLWIGVSPWKWLKPNGGVEVLFS